MSRIKFALFFAAVALVLCPHQLRATASGTITYAVGNCQPRLKSYPTISAAVAATPTPNVILVCPGTYNEQVVITSALTLQGISNAGSDQAIIAPPTGGLVQNATDDSGNSVAAQVLVQNVATGSVNISNIVVDGTGNGVSFCQTQPIFVVGIFYQNSAGTVNRVTARNQTGNGCGIAVWAEGGSSNPSVTIENSSIHDFDFQGIDCETNSTTPELTATIKGNDINDLARTGVNDILVSGGVNGTISGNLVSGSNITLNQGTAGSVSQNTVVAAGISVFSNGFSITSNKIMDSPNTGIFLEFSVATTAPVKSNSITHTAGSAIDFNCNANNNVQSNVITDAITGINNVPSSVTSSNKYFTVGTIRSQGVCP